MTDAESNLRSLLKDVVSYAKDQAGQFRECAGHHSRENPGAEAVAFRAAEILDRIILEIHSVKQDKDPQKTKHVHVIPIGDVELHSAQRDCWCYPKEVEPNLWAHNAKDCREAKERMTGEKCSPGWVTILENAVS